MAVNRNNGLGTRWLWKAIVKAGVLGAVVFLPAFILAFWLETLRFREHDSPTLNLLGDAVLGWLGLLPSVLLGASFHALAVWGLQRMAAYRRLATVLLSPLLPLTMLAVHRFPATLLAVRIEFVAVVTLLYGLAAAKWIWQKAP